MSVACVDLEDLILLVFFIHYILSATFSMRFRESVPKFLTLYMFHHVQSASEGRLMMTKH